MTPFLARIALAGIVLVLIGGMAHKELSAECRWLIAFYELGRDDAWSGEKRAMLGVLS